MKWIGRLFCLFAVIGVVYTYPVMKELRDMTAENGITPGLIFRSLLLLLCFVYLAGHLGAIVANLLGRALVDLIYNVHGGAPIKQEDEVGKIETSEKDKKESEN